MNSLRLPLLERQEDAEGRAAPGHRVRFDGTAVRREKLPHFREDARERPSHKFGIFIRAERRRADDVGEEDAGKLALFRHVGSL